MHPAALAGGFGALDVAFTGQALYALRYSERKKDREEARRSRRVVIAAPAYRRPAAPRKRTSEGDRPPS